MLVPCSWGSIFQDLPSSLSGGLLSFWRSLCGGPLQCSQGCEGHSRECWDSFMTRYHLSLFSVLHSWISKKTRRGVTIVCVGFGDGQCVNMTVWTFYNLEGPACPKCSVNLHINPRNKTMQFGAVMPWTALLGKTTSGLAVCFSKRSLPLLPHLLHTLWGGGPFSPA